MSEYTTVYLRHKNMPLLKKKEHPSHEECQSQSKEDLMKVIREIDEYNKQVAKSLGCKLFYLTTTPSRELTVLPCSPSPSVLTNVLLEEVLCFYKEEIEHCKKAIAKNKEDIARCHAVGQACAVVHTVGHAIGYPIYDLTSIVYQYGIEHCVKAVEARKQEYMDRLFYWREHWKEYEGEWAEFMLS